MKRKKIFLSLSMEELEESFDIWVDLKGKSTGLTVIPGMEKFLIVLDGVHLTEIQHTADDIQGWEQLDGNLDDETVQAIGEAIESHYM